MVAPMPRARPFGLFERMLAGRYLRAKRQHGGVALISIISVTAIDSFAKQTFARQFRLISFL